MCFYQSAIELLNRDKKSGKTERIFEFEFEYSEQMRIFGYLFTSLLNIDMYFILHSVSPFFLRNKLQQGL